MEKIEGYNDGFVSECYAYLDDLRLSGVTNMFGAPAYLMEEYALTEKEAFDIWSAWTEQFGKNE